ncbi:MAG: tRNA-dihydrouridine synthase, partial [Pseudomonadota bacterium]
VIANGDITDEISAARALAASGADGVMIGRGARGKPWLPAQVMAALSAANAPDVPAGHALAEMVTGHYEAMLSFYGWDLGRKNARKHLGWYMDAAATPPGLRRAVLTEPDPERVRRLIEEAMIS